MLMRARLVGLLLAFALFCACGGEVSPETRIRERLAAAVEAAESRDLAALRDFVAGGYADAQGRDKKAIEGLLALYLRQSEGLHLFPVIHKVSLTSDERATATLLLAMAGRPIRDEAELRTLEADLYRIDLVVTRESKDWRVAEASWEPVSVF